MSVSCGIVGLPNVGKSTIFNALTSAKAEVANYPFCTINPNTGIVKVPDHRLSDIAQYIPTQKIIPAAVTFVDIAGLVKGASKGEGLGNQFLGHIRETHAIAHIVRCFNDSNITHVEGTIDPIRDITVIDTELMLADLETVTKRYSTIQRAARSGDKKSKAIFGALEQVKTTLENGKPVRTLNLSQDELNLIQELHLITAKKVLYVANIDETSVLNSQSNLYVKKVLDYAKSEQSAVLTICGKIESEVAELTEDERTVFLKDLGMTEPGLNRVIRASYDLLGLQTFFTAGPQEIRAWTIHKGWKAPKAAGVIHSDFEKGFIRAEVYHYDDLMKYKNEQTIKDSGVLRVEGKDYLVQDGDIMHFRFNV